MIPTITVYITKPFSSSKLKTQVEKKSSAFSLKDTIISFNRHYAIKTFEQSQSTLLHTNSSPSCSQVNISETWIGWISSPHFKNNCKK